MKAPVANTQWIVDFSAECKSPNMATRSPAIGATVFSSKKRISYRIAVNPMNSMLRVMTNLFCGIRRMLDRDEGGGDEGARQDELTINIGAA